MADVVKTQSELLALMPLGATGATTLQTLRDFVVSVTAGVAGGGVGPVLTVGATGATGAQGATGAASTVPGATGATGAGTQGNTGATGAASTVPGATGATGPTPSLAASRAVATDGAGALVASTTTALQLGYLDTLTGNVQGQLDGKAERSGWVADGDYTVGIGVGQNGVLTISQGRITAIQQAF